jgi:hypothetical protein
MFEDVKRGTTSRRTKNSKPGRRARQISTFWASIRCVNIYFQEAACMKYGDEQGLIYVKESAQTQARQHTP